MCIKEDFKLIFLMLVNVLAAIFCNNIWTFLFCELNVVSVSCTVSYVLLSFVYVDTKQRL